MCKTFAENKLIKCNNYCLLFCPFYNCGFSALRVISAQENLWQTCTEFGHIKTSTKDIMFGDVNIHFTLDLCSDVFGSW